MVERTGEDVRDRPVENELQERVEEEDGDDSDGGLKRVVGLLVSGLGATVSENEVFS